MPERRRTAINAVLAVAQVVVTAGVLFVLYWTVIRSLGIEQLGVWSVILATATVARTSELGVAGSATKFVAASLARSEVGTAAEIVETSVLTVAGAVGLVAVAGYPLLGSLVELVLPAGGAASKARDLLPYALVSLWLASVAGVYLSALDGCQRIVERSLIGIAGAIAYLVLGLVLLPPLGLVGLAVAQVAQGVLTLALALAVLRRHLPALAIVPHRWRSPMLRRILGYGLQLQVVSIMALLFEPTTKWLLTAFAGLSAVGYFEMASQLVGRLRALVVAGAQVLVPAIATLTETDPGALVGLYRRYLQVIGFVALPSFALLLSATPLITLVWLGGPSPSFVILTCAITLAWVVNTLTVPAYFVYLGSGRLRWNTAGHVTIGLINGAFGYVLGDLLGAAGVLAAYVLALTAGSAFIAFAFHREHGLTQRTWADQGSGPMLMVLLVAATAALVTAHLYTANWSGPGLAASPVLLVLALLGLTTWLHPLRPKLQSWLQAGSPPSVTDPVAEGPAREMVAPKPDRAA